MSRSPRRRSPRGSADRNDGRIRPARLPEVAPRAGARIETPIWEKHPDWTLVPRVLDSDVNVRIDVPVTNDGVDSWRWKSRSRSTW